MKQIKAHNDQRGAHNKEILFSHRRLSLTPCQPVFKMLFLFLFICATLAVMSSSFNLGSLSPTTRSTSSSRLYMAGGFGKVVASSPSSSHSQCLCNSGKTYQECCEPYHSGTALPPTSTALVRSRFSALRSKLVNYLIDTTHPDHKDFADANESASKYKQWQRALKNMAQEYDFMELAFENEKGDNEESLASSPDGATTSATFVVKLKKAQGDNKVESMKETSEFCKSNGKWLYRRGDVPGGNPFVKEVPQAPKKLMSTAKRGVPRGN